MGGWHESKNRPGRLKGDRITWVRIGLPFWNGAIAGNAIYLAFHRTVGAS